MSIASELPPHLAALQLVIARCPSPELKKELIVVAACCGAITADDASLLISANLLETA